MSDVIKCGDLHMYIKPADEVVLTLLDNFGHTVECTACVVSVDGDAGFVVRNPEVAGTVVKLDAVFKFNCVSADVDICEQSCECVKTVEFDSGTYTVLRIVEAAVLSGIQNRSNLRVLCEQPIQLVCTIVDESTMSLSSVEVYGVMLDVSYGGIRVLTAMSMQKGEKVTVKLAVGVEDTDLEFIASVVYIGTVSETYQYRVGLKFLDMSVECRAKLEKYMSELQSVSNPVALS